MTQLFLTFGLPSSWLFVINGLITLLIGAAGFFMIPDYPNNPNPRAYWLSDEHIAMSAERLDRHGRQDAKKISWESAKWVAQTRYLQDLADRRA